jgi:hypothetical protein
MRDKGLFYLGTAAGWWRLEGVDSGLLQRVGVRPESPVRIVGSVRQGYVLSVDEIQPGWRPG